MHNACGLRLVPGSGCLDTEHGWCDRHSRKEVADATVHSETHVPRQGIADPGTENGAARCLGVVERNADVGVTWVHSYVSDDKTRTFCVYDGPDPEAIRTPAKRNGLPVDHITRVSVLDPYFYR